MLKEKLIQGINQLNLSLGDDQVNLLIDYVQLLNKWNKTYNLTAIRDINEMISVHLLDSLAVAPYLQGYDILDVGTGAGLPGIPLAICFPEYNFTLLDSNGKKTRFVQQAVLTLGLKNINVVQSRIEHFVSQDKFTTIISRAFAAIDDMLKGAAHLCRHQGEFLAMKGIDPEKEWQAVAADYHLLETIKLSVPFIDGDRHLVRIRLKNK
ncbi:16S rRNA (guanine(527)-N(7))-methyltransferase RsmG [Piscirickettsia salmonis]|uniref:16S rRNA (guanine(527)-N(7))-methyltransferase RsmG n=1 Tax=Piscirickettsia salmonis TaxID=1238 RepID=UPI0002DE3E66|nr:16S rRNA (guanine(527)-N(7))-methyltransferase RsmG [Piscirickettsia salmonis]APS57565.1 16S rRNA (guanine(527)-N(7))-methyltransferase RsmG [Piscirickettsia salmonis]ERL63536.1 16S rRNA (guanine(527)-N(7))-methyltransferase GidB [Piscirickettsia salmonis LF-89 = ATCC VR-1361]PEQ16334.1 16S rRNA (guanine(527)-N(7))-methyltransferase RsmG [Piscirickettsia salmonis]QGN79001.1 Ribosomal RNA small subunit methyltransferase G [Piscirickettsia salmonis]QGN82585.1 Ribosomal RNA small subunit methy